MIYWGLYHNVLRLCSLGVVPLWADNIMLQLSTKQSELMDCRYIIILSLILVIVFSFIADCRLWRGDDQELSNELQRVRHWKVIVCNQAWPGSGWWGLQTRGKWLMDLQLFVLLVKDLYFSPDVSSVSSKAGSVTVPWMLLFNPMLLPFSALTTE